MIEKGAYSMGQLAALKNGSWRLFGLFPHRFRAQSLSEQDSHTQVDAQGLAGTLYSLASLVVRAVLHSETKTQHILHEQDVANTDETSTVLNQKQASN